MKYAIGMKEAGQNDERDYLVGSRNSSSSINGNLLA
jgi:hypothetical protein